MGFPGPDPNLHLALCRNAFDSTAWNRSYTIVPLTPKREEPKITRPDGLIGKNPCRNATVL